MADDSSLSIFNDSQAISSSWTAFLTAPEVGCPVVATPAPTGSSTTGGGGGGGSSGAGGNTNSAISLTCLSTRFWSLSFGSDSNQARFSTSNYAVGDSYLLSLAPGVSLPPNTGLFQVFQQFGIGASNSTGDAFIDSLVNAIASVQIDSDPTSRNALWLTPGVAYRSDVALTLKAGKPTDAFATALQNKLGLSGALSALNNLKILVQRTCTGAPVTMAGTGEQWQIKSTYSLSFNLDAGGFDFWVTLSPTGVSFDMLQDESSDWSNLTNLGAAGLSGSKPDWDELLEAVELMRLSAGVSLSGEVWWEVTASIAVKRDTAATPPQAPLKIFLDFRYPEGIFTGGLVTQEFYSAPGDNLLPTYQPWQALLPPKDPVPSWDLRQLSSKIDALPPGLPTEFIEADVAMEFLSPKWITFTATLGQPLNASGTQSLVPMPSSFIWDALGLTVTISDTFSCSLFTTFTLSPSRLRPNDPPAEIGISVDYTAGEWILSGNAQDLNCGNLAEFFDPSCSDSVADVLGKLTITDLSLVYTYDKGAASSFIFTGIITLGELQLRLFYQYASSQAGLDTAAKKTLTGDDAKLALDEVPKKSDGSVGTDWRFECDLEASDGTATVGSILDSISDGAEGILPDFIDNIKIPSADGREPVTIKVSKTPSNQVLFVLRIMIGSFAFSIIQVSNPGAAGNAKKMLRFSVEAMTLPQEVPLIGKPPLPFDELQYLWVNDSGGVNQLEVTALNDSILTGDDALLYKSTNSGDATNDGPIDRDKLSQVDQANIAKNKDPDPTVLVPGHHFTVIRTQVCVLDHVFEPSTPKSQNQKAPVEVQSTSHVLVEVSTLTPPNSTNQAGPSKGDVVFSLGPLSFSAVSLQFKESSGDRFIAFTFDATFTMGALTFELLGFGLDIPLPKNLTLDALMDPRQLESIMANTRPTLSGLSLAFSKPPLLIAGGFEHNVVETSDGEEDIFLGAIGIGFPPYTFVGLGEYMVIKHAGSQYKSVFLYAKLDGPIVTLEFASIEGIRLGVGYNSVVRSPTIEEIFSFPFIDDGSTAGVGNDPMAILQALVAPASGTAWVTPQDGQYWFAAGMTLTAFAVLSITAVAMFEFGQTGLIISIFADAVASMPPTKGTSTEGLIVYAELGVVAELNFEAGYLRVEAALNPVSFLLVPQCHLFGGFALCYWFGSNEHAGDWVFSLGGYHPAFQPPAWYPVPTRVGVSFQAGILSVTGESYFAVTPRCVMGGAMLHASMSLGPIQAWLDAAFDALINFHPLHYNVSFQVSIGVSFNLDFWFIHIHISATVGATLQIQGPEFGGIAHVDFYLFGFDVSFGASPSIPPAQTIDEFWELVHKPGPETTGSESSTAVEASHQSSLQSCLSFPSFSLGLDTIGPPLGSSGTPTVTNVASAGLKFILEDGNFPQPKTTSDTSATQPPASTGDGAIWYVKGGTFKFRIASEFALSDARITQTSPDPPIFMPVPATFPFSRPMRLSDPIWSILQVTVYYEKGTKAEAIISNWSSIDFDIKNVPAATWASYDPTLDPIFASDPRALVGQQGGPNTVPLAMALKLSAPPPQLARSTIPAFNATDASKFGILDFRADKLNGTAWFVPVAGSLQTRFIPRALTNDEKPPDTALTDAQKIVINKARWAKVKKSWSAFANDPKVQGLISDKADDGQTTTSKGGSAMKGVPVATGGISTLEGTAMITTPGGSALTGVPVSTGGPATIQGTVISGDTTTTTRASETAKVSMATGQSKMVRGSAVGGSAMGGSAMGGSAMGGSAMGGSAAGGSATGGVPATTGGVSNLPGTARPTPKQDGMIALFTTIYGWNTQRPSDESAVTFTKPGGTQVVTMQPWDLDGSFPTKMINDLEGNYLDLPRMGVVSAQA